VDPIEKILYPKSFSARITSNIRNMQQVGRQKDFMPNKLKRGQKSLSTSSVDIEETYINEELPIERPTEKINITAQSHETGDHRSEFNKETENSFKTMVSSQLETQKKFKETATSTIRHKETFDNKVRGRRQRIEERLPRKEEEEEPEEEKGRIFTPEDSQALCRGFIILSYKWLGKEKACTVIPEVFPGGEAEKRTKFLQGLYDEKIPIDSEYAEKVAFNILGLLRTWNPDRDISAIVDFVLQTGSREKLPNEPRYAAGAKASGDALPDLEEILKLVKAVKREEKPDSAPKN